jgi:hypothetical protein
MNCIEATGFKSPKGYCRAQLNGKRHLAHRVSYVLSRGISIEDINGYLVCHKCDNPSCINPDHLFLGTNKDNLDDMREKGRGKVLDLLGKIIHLGSYLMQILLILGICTAYILKGR